MENDKIKISSEDLAKLCYYSTPTISNAIETFNVRDRTIGYASREIHCQVPELAPIVGYTVTCTVDTTTPGLRKERFIKFSEFLDSVHRASKPVIVAMKYVGYDKPRSCCVGDILATALQRIGAIGIITDVGFRDFSGIRKRTPDFQIFSPGLVAGHGNVEFLEVGTVVSICGLTIKPGNLLHGDENGIVDIPVDFIDIKSLIDKAEYIVREEQKIIDFINSSDYTFEEMKKRLAPEDGVLDWE